MDTLFYFIKDESHLFRQLLNVFEEAFAWQNYQLPDDKYIQFLLSKEDFIVLVALINGEVAGGLTAYTLYAYDIPGPFIYIYDLGMKTKYRSQGIGSGLLNVLKEYSEARGISDFYVTTEQEDNLRAINFYRNNSPGDELKVLEFSYQF